MNILVTKPAGNYIQKMLQKEDGSIFRLSIKKSGCSGYSYLPEVINKINPADTRLVISDGISIYIDPVWLNLLENLTIDYVEEDKNGLKQKRLIFTNPKEISRCGCGESFHV